VQQHPEIALAQATGAELLVAAEPRLLEGMRKRIVADVVQQRGEANREAFALIDAVEIAAFVQRGERAAGEVIRAERMFKT
jgi:hypothetical protein